MAAIELMGLKHIIVLQNKIDLIHQNSAKSNYMDIRKFIQGTPAGKIVFSPNFITCFIRYLTNYPHFCTNEV